MIDTARLAPGHWTDGEPPPNVRLGPDTVITGEQAFKRFYSRWNDALTVGAHCRLDGVHFALGEEGRLSIGDYCRFSYSILLCELEIRIGGYVVIGWNVTLADTDFHPLAPAERIADAIACSPLGKGRPRPPIACRPIIIEDDVWIGPGATILKGVRLGAGAWVEPGAVVTCDAPPGARLLGNPARIVGLV